ncbi:unnamed protein product [Peniophora sp. CBMAI 1063]|nr:unnamed protein product [Peniophora sp. CBMAI 1063]
MSPEETPPGTLPMPPDATGCLAVETLLHIFHFLLEVNPTKALLDLPSNIIFQMRPYSSDETSRSRSRSLMYWRLGWITVTQVSSRWRTISLEDASLWTRVPLNLGHVWAYAFAERSQPGPVRITVPPAHEKWMTYFIHDVHSRIHTLEAPDCLPTKALSGIGALGDESCQRSSLERLVIQKNPIVITKFWLRLFGTSQLKELVLQLPSSKADEFPWAIVRLSNLTLLDLEFGVGVGLSPSSHFHLGTALRGLKTLTTFRLHCTGYDHSHHYQVQRSSPDMDAIDSFYWDNLERLDVRVDACTVILLATAIRYPTSAVVRLETTNSNVSGLFKRIFMPFVVERHGSSATKRLSIEETQSTTDLTARISVKGVDAAGPESSKRLLSYATICPKHFRVGLTQFTADVGPDSIQELELDLPERFDLEYCAWLPCLGSLCEITHLYVRIPGCWKTRDIRQARSLAGLLQQLLLPPSSTSYSKFPKLRMLELKDSRAGPLLSRNFGAVAPVDELNTAVAGMLDEISEARRQSGMAIRDVYKL